MCNGLQTDLDFQECRDCLPFLHIDTVLFTVRLFFENDVTDLKRSNRLQWDGFNVELSFLNR